MTPSASAQLVRRTLPGCRATFQRPWHKTLVRFTVFRWKMPSSNVAMTIELSNWTLSLLWPISKNFGTMRKVTPPCSNAPQSQARLIKSVSIWRILGTPSSMTRGTGGRWLVITSYRNTSRISTWWKSNRRSFVKRMMNRLKSSPRRWKQRREQHSFRRNRLLRVLLRYTSGII